jgi:hypothetical protein
VNQQHPNQPRNQASGFPAHVFDDPAQPQAQPPKKNTGRTVLIVAGAVTGVLALAGIAAASGGGAAQQAATSPQPAATVTVTAPAEPGAEVTVTAPPAPAVTVTKPAPPAKTVTAAPPAAESTIDEGTWEVGVDVKPGRYKTTVAVDEGAMCYWKITTTGKPGNIVDNEIVSGGRPTVTIKKGQDFTTQDCGTWTKVN